MKQGNQRIGLQNTMRFLAKISLVLLGGLAATHAAAETTRYHGSQCQAYYGSQAGDFRHYSSGIRNVSGNTRWVSCAIEREVVWYYGPYNTAITANVYNGGGTLWCEGFNNNYSTGSITDSHSVNTTLSGNRSLVMWLNPPTSNTHYVRCLLPPNSYVRALYVYEPES